MILGVLVLFSGIVRTYYAFRYQSIEHLRTYSEKRERMFVSLVGFCFTLPGTIYLFTHWLDFATFHVSDEVRIAACVIMFFNQLFFWHIHKTLGENWSPILEIRREQELITIGPYKYIRHPMYTCIYIHTLSLLFVSSNWIVGGMGILSFALIYPFRVADEEKMMIDAFGDRYRYYMKHTGRLLPKLF